MAAAPVLVVEDDETVTEIMHYVLQSEGYRIECVSLPELALARFATRGPDAYKLVLSDSFAGWRAPYGWLAHLRTQTAAPIVICTGWPAATYADYRARGFAAYLGKPFDIDDLLAVVASLGGRVTAARGHEEARRNGA